MLSSIVLAKTDAEKESEKSVKEAEKLAAEEVKRSEKTSSKEQTISKEDTDYGKVEFDDVIDTNTTNYEDAIYIGFDDNLNPEIYINSQEFPEISTNARLYFYDTGITSSLAILSNGVQCLDCEATLYGDDDWYLDVDHFSSWTIVENNFSNGIQEGSAIYSDGSIGKGIDAVFIIGFGNNTVYNGSEFVIVDQSAYNVSGTIYGNPYYDPTGGVKGTGAYVFDGVDDAVLFPAKSQYSSELEEEFTIITQANNAQPGGGGGTAITIIGYSGAINDRNFHFYTNTFNTILMRITNGTDNTAANVGSQVGSNEWDYTSIAWNNTLKEVYFWLNKSNLEREDNLTISNDLVMNFKSFCWGAFGPTCASNLWNGSIAQTQIFNRQIDTDEIRSIAYSEIPKIYQTYSNYTSQVFNVSDYDTEVYQNVWNAINLTVDTGAANQITAYGRAGTCATVEAQSWTTGTKTGVDFNFGAGLPGDCFQYKLVFGGDWNYSDEVTAVATEATKIVTPSIADITISPQPTAINSDYITGNATFLLNDTDSGELLYEWFVNNVNVYNQTVTGLVNGSSGVSSLSPAFTAVGNTVFFNVTAINTVPFSSTTTSSGTTTISDSAFTLDAWSPADNGTVQNLTEPEEVNFNVTITDIDGDANTTWYLDGDVYATGEAIVFRTLYSTQGDHTLTATTTDGTTTTTVSWALSVTNTDTLGWTLPLMLGLIALVVLFGGLLMFLDQIHVVFRLVCFLMLPFMLVALTAFMVKVSEISGLSTVTVLCSGLFKAMIALTVLSVGYVIVFFIASILNSIKEKKEKKENDLVQ